MDPTRPCQSFCWARRPTTTRWNAPVALQRIARGRGNKSARSGEPSNAACQRRQTRPRLQPARCGETFARPNGALSNPRGRASTSSGTACGFRSSRAQAERARRRILSCSIQTPRATIPWLLLQRASHPSVPTRRPSGAKTVGEVAAEGAFQGELTISCFAHALTFVQRYSTQRRSPLDVLAV